jgi:hypothetical protein
VPSGSAGRGWRRTYFTREAVRRGLAILRALPPIEKATLRDLVAELYDDIAAQRDKGVGWEQIHAEINKTTPIAMRTLMLYISDEKRARTKKKR